MNVVRVVEEPADGICNMAFTDRGNYATYHRYDGDCYPPVGTPTVGVFGFVLRSQVTFDAPNTQRSDGYTHGSPFPDLKIRLRVCKIPVWMYCDLSNTDNLLRHQYQHPVRYEFIGTCALL